jgi:hypothetical protein
VADDDELATWPTAARRSWEVRRDPAADTKLVDRMSRASLQKLAAVTVR